VPRPGIHMSGNSDNHGGQHPGNEADAEIHEALPFKITIVDHCNPAGMASNLRFQFPNVNTVDEQYRRSSALTCPDTPAGTNFISVSSSNAIFSMANTGREDCSLEFPRRNYRVTSSTHETD
ncbi:MAG TPA: hypothetical protein VMH23_09115, partial [Bacteroidota bacterium]|nr:hypothetical protein [Bacteroidota bacterium]